mgnify:FL=1
MAKRNKYMEYKERNVNKICHNLKIAGFCLLTVSVILVVVGAVFLAKHNLHIGISLLVVGIFVLAISLVLVVISFIPNFSNYTIKTSQYIQQAGKEDIEDLMSAKVSYPKRRETIFDEPIQNEIKKNQIYCKYCGKQIDEDSKFCKYCGKEL